jgi:hypothetical protein
VLRALHARRPEPAETGAVIPFSLINPWTLVYIRRSTHTHSSRFIVAEKKACANYMIWRFPIGTENDRAK